MTNDTKGYYHFYNVDDPNRWGRVEMPDQFSITRQWLLKSGVMDHERIILELGCGIGPLNRIHPNYIGLDFSLVALRKFATNARYINGDMQSLPIKDGSVDFIFSWAALEHVPNPEQVLTEVERILKVGGTALLAPAWNVRSWAAKALPIRPYRALSWRDCLWKVTIPVRNNLVWRALFAIPRRLYREMYALWRRPVVFDYKRLSPNLQEYIYTDCDAFTSMDAHTAILYFKSRDWFILSHHGFMKRIMVRHEPIVVKKVDNQV